MSISRSYFFVLLLFGAYYSVHGQSAGSQSWEEIKKRGTGEIHLHWYTSVPFIYKENGKLTGIEYHLVQEFKKHVKYTYGVKLTDHWQEGRGFKETYDYIRTTGKPGEFGVSAFSITPKRREKVDFTPPYMADICVLLSNQNVPIVNNTRDFDRLANNLTAITIEGTTYEDDLLRIKEEHELEFAIEYIPSHQNILKAIAGKTNTFGFIDLPIYLRAFKSDPELKVKRQNLFPVKRKGYAFVMPKGSGWEEPFKSFHQSRNFQLIIEEISSRYFDPTVYNTVRELYENANSDLILLTRERELQKEKLKGTSKTLESSELWRNIFIVTSVVSLGLLVVVFILYRGRSRDNQLLVLQKEKIQKQAENIESQRKGMEVRNSNLLQINEEKNQLIRVLAHDLRTPINQIDGLANLYLLENQDLNDMQKDLINQIRQSAQRLSKMISKILDVDAIENNKTNLVLERIEINKLLKQISDAFRNTANNKNIKLKFIPADQSLYAELDSLYFTEVVENLISNALKFSNPGTTIEVGSKRADQTVEVFVRDQGPGFTDEDKQKLFKKFEKLSARPTAGEPSTGLGLSIVKKFVTLMQGEIRYESTVGKGTTFHLAFPAQD